MNRRELISDEMLMENRVLHMRPDDGYGGSGWKHAEVVLAFLVGLGANSMLDYGCGEGTLRRELERARWRGDIAEYDPAVEGKDRPPPGQFDLVVCTDVMEHVEEQRIETVLAHIASLSSGGCYMTIALRPSNKFLSNGMNAHLTIRPASWWVKRATIGWSKVVHREYRTKDSELREVRLWMRK